MHFISEHFYCKFGNFREGFISLNFAYVVITLSFTDEG